jgi:hypothetical protein
MPPITLKYQPFAFEKKEAELAKEPGLKDCIDKLENSIRANPMQAPSESRVLKDGKKITFYEKTARVESYSKTMIFSKDEITIRYVVFQENNLIAVVNIFFPNI